MKSAFRIVSVFLIILISHYTSLCQTYKFYQTKNIHNQLRLNIKTGEVYQIQDDGQTYLVHPATTPDNQNPDRYILQKTENIWTYILLDQYSGKLWQCQFSVKGLEYISSWEINTVPLSYSESKKFSIEPMISMFQFHLYNEDTGEIYQFQWSTKEGNEYRWIKKIK